MEKCDIYAVVVTYNRLTLLKKSLEALLNQTQMPAKIIVVNNASTDETSDYLHTLENNACFHILNLPENLGGAGGFNIGMREAVCLGADWVWIMDDDTLPEPNALEKLLECKDLDPNIGYLSSRVVWTDGNNHLMNIPVIRQNVTVNEQTYFFDKFIPFNAYPLDCASFVSLMIKSDVIKKIGLPIKEFFIWLDDYEYTTRINKNGYFGLYVYNSVAVHATEKNEGANIITAATSQGWKFYYEIRNRLYLKRQECKNYILFLFKSRKIYHRYIRRAKRRTEGKQEFIKFLKSGYKSGLKFNPPIEFI